MPTVLLLIDFVEGTGDGEILDLAKLIQDHACVRTVRGMGENLLLRNPAAQRILREAAAEGTPIHTLELTVRVRNALKADNVYTVQQLCRLTEQELLKIPGLQRKGVSEIQEVLHSHGLKLAEPNTAVRAAASFSTVEGRAQILQDDKDRSAEGLARKYSPEGEGEHPLYPRADWADNVSRGNTLLGYWEWVAHAMDEQFSQG